MTEPSPEQWAKWYAHKSNKEATIEAEELVAEDVMLEDTSPEGLMQNAELARQVAEEVYQSDDDSDEKVDNGNYPQDMDKTLI